MGIIAPAGSVYRDVLLRGVRKRHAAPRIINANVAGSGTADGSLTNPIPAGPPRPVTIGVITPVLKFSISKL
jgi:hypothetical protein